MTVLDCSDCQTIKKIPFLPNLILLHCMNCLGLTEIPTLPNLRHIYARGCKNLVKICPQYRLVRLHCELCVKLTELPKLPFIFTLCCNGCDGLKEISGYYSLRKLWCNDCINLVRIYNVHLSHLFCQRCPKLIETPETLHNCFLGSPWANCNRVFSDSLVKLIRLQKIMRKYLKIKRIIRWLNSNEFSEWFYHPDGPGGRMVLRRLNKNDITSRIKRL